MFKLKNPVQKNLVLFKVNLESEGKSKEYSQEISDQPMNLVTVESSFGLYGTRYFLPIFRSNRKVKSLNFIGEVIRSRTVLSKISSSYVALLLKGITKRKGHYLVPQLFWLIFLGGVFFGI